MALEAALACVLAHAPAPEVELVELARAHGRVLAGDVVADADVPGRALCAMDGYAVRSAGLAGDGARLGIVGEARAGHPSPVTVQPHEALAVSTGAVLPDGADAVVAVERTQRDGGAIVVSGAVHGGDHVRRPGDHVRCGDHLLGRGTRLGPVELGVGALIGRGRLPCARRPRVGVVTTGDELVVGTLSPATDRAPNTTVHTLPALIEAQGAIVGTIATAPDDLDVITATLRRALVDADVLVVSGGFSDGPYDLSRPALAAVGVEELFWKVAMRPGQRTWFGVTSPAVGPRVPVFGLPSNQVSAIVAYHLLVAPLLSAMLARPVAADVVPAVMTRDVPKRPGLAHVVRCQARPTERGWEVTPTSAPDSHALTSMLDTNALAVLDAGHGPVAAGDVVSAMLLGAASPVG